MKIVNTFFNRIDYGRMQITVETEDGTHETIFSYYPDELSFHQDELIGLTIPEARDLFVRKDTKFLRCSGKCSCRN